MCSLEPWQAALAPVLPCDLETTDGRSPCSGVWVGMVEGVGPEACQSQRGHGSMGARPRGPGLRVLTRLSTSLSLTCARHRHPHLHWRWSRELLEDLESHCWAHRPSPCALRWVPGALGTRWLGTQENRQIHTQSLIPGLHACTTLLFGTLGLLPHTLFWCGPVTSCSGAAAFPHYGQRPRFNETIFLLPG